MYRFYFICLIQCLILNMISGNTIEVCPSCSVSSIEQAICDAQAFDTIQLRAAVYKEYDLLIDKPLYLHGEAGVVIDGQLKGAILTVQSDSVSLDNFSIKNVGTSYTEDFAAIRVVRAKHFEIKNLHLSSLFFGIFVEKSAQGKIHNNVILGNAKSEHNSGNGIHLWYCKDVDIYGNDVQQMRDGIYFEFVDSSRIYNNISYRNLRYGLHFMFSNHDVYYDNVFRQNGAGVAVMFSKFIDMRNNEFLDNWGTASYGLLLKEITDATIENNYFHKNTIGINIEGSNRIRYEKNTFDRNGWALRVRGACYTNTFKANNFLGNSFDVSYNSKINDNVFVNNHWSEYTGYDLDKDGIGDVPYRPVKLFSYIVNKTPETIILLRSLFINLIDFSEKVSPVFTPDKLVDKAPQMRKYDYRN